MAMIKTYSPIWYIEDSYANVATALKAEGIRADHIMFAVPASLAGNVVVFIKRDANVA